MVSADPDHRQDHPPTPSPKTPPIRTGTAPHAMAASRDLAVGALHPTGHDNIAAALRKRAQGSCAPDTQA